MYHYFNSLTNTRGDALIGYFVKAIDATTGNEITIYADSNATPIVSVSGVDNAAQVDKNGNISFYVDNAGDFNLDVYATDATTFVQTFLDMAIGTGPTGAQGPAGDVAKVTTRTALAAIAGTTAGLTRYLVEKGREGTFVFDSTNISASVSGGFAFGDSSQAVFVLPASDLTGASGCWVRKISGNIITPYMFGATGGYLTQALAAAGVDDGAAINAMFAFWQTNTQYIPDLLGLYWGTSTTITIHSPDNTAQNNPGVIRAGKIVAVNGSTGTDLIQIQFQYGHIQGTLGAYGTGSTTYSSRGWVNGIALMNCAGMKLDSYEAENFKRQGIYLSLLKITGVTGGNNIGLRIGKGHGRYCGSAAGQTNGSQLTYAFDSVTLNGTTNATTQTSTVHFTTALDPQIQGGDWFVYTETSGKFTAYQASSVDFVGNTITFYLWLPAGVSTGSMDSAHGGLVYLTGNNTAYNRWGPQNAQNCGVVWNDTGLYGASVELVGSEVSGINHVRGMNTVGGGYIGGGIEFWHSESTYLDEVETLGVSGYTVGPAESRDVQGTNRFDQSYKSCPRLTGGARGGFQKKSAAVFSKEDGWIGAEAGFTVSTDATLIPSQTFTIDNRPSNRHYRAVYSNSVQQTLTVTIDFLQNYSDLFFGKDWARLDLRGTETRGGIKVSVTFALTAALTTAGWTISGTTSHSQFRGPSTFLIWYDVAHKIVYLTRQDREPQELNGTTVNGDVAATLSPSSSTKVQIWNTPLTAARAVTLPTTGDVKDGDTFLIVRTAAATGASSLNVGTGPLKALSAGQWCRVTYSSSATAWFETEFGSL